MLIMHVSITSRTYAHPRGPFGGPEYDHLYLTFRSNFGDLDVTRLEEVRFRIQNLSHTRARSMYYYDGRHVVLD